MYNHPLTCKHYSSGTENWASSIQDNSAMCNDAAFACLQCHHTSFDTHKELVARTALNKSLSIVNYFLMDISLTLMNSVKQKHSPKPTHPQQAKQPCVLCHSYLSHFQRYFQQKNVFGYNTGICVIVTKGLQCKAALWSWSPWKLDSDAVLCLLQRPAQSLCAWWDFFPNLPATDLTASSWLFPNWDAN